MKKYTIEGLKAINESYNRYYGVSEGDVVKTNDWVKFIENGRSKEIPQVGDIVEFTNKYGGYYENAHIESIADEMLYVCENPYVPFVGFNMNKNILSTSTSGGAWSYIPMHLTYVGTKEKRFADWGHSGACGDGTVDFYAKVNVWEYTEGTHEFTTKTHDKFNVYIKEQDENYEYKYQISKDGTNKTDYKSDEEYHAWLKTFHGVEKDGNFIRNSKIVWTYKQESQCIPIEAYLKIENAIIDSTLCNGTIQECKRVYEGTIVKTFLPFQNDLIELKNVKVQYMNALKTN